MNNNIIKSIKSLVYKLDSTNIFEHTDNILSKISYNVKYDLHANVNGLNNYECIIKCEKHNVYETRLTISSNPYDYFYIESKLMRLFIDNIVSSIFNEKDTEYVILDPDKINSQDAIDYLCYKHKNSYNNIIINSQKFINSNITYNVNNIDHKVFSYYKIYNNNILIEPANCSIENVILLLGKIIYNISYVNENNMFILIFKFYFDRNPICNLYSKNSNSNQYKEIISKIRESKINSLL